MTNERRINPEPLLPLAEVDKDIDAIGDHGGMDGISAILRFAYDEIEWRPTGHVAILVALACLANGFIDSMLYRNKIRSAPLYAVEAAVFIALLAVAFYIGSFFLDRQNLTSNAEIMDESRKAIIHALEQGHVVIRPLETNSYDMLKRLAMGKPDFKAKVQPILDLGVAPKEQFSVDDEP